MGLILDNGTMEILYGSFLLFWIIYLYFVKDYGYWEERQVPHVPAVFPFGSVSELVLGQCYTGAIFDKIYKAYEFEPYVGYNEVREPSLLIRDPDLIKLILQKDFLHFTDHMWVEVHPKEYMMRSLLHMKGEEWRERRSKLTPMYTAAKMEMMFVLVKQCSDLLRNVLEKTSDISNVIDVKDILSRFTIDIIATCAFGIEINLLSNKVSEFYHVGKKVLNLNFKTLFKTYIFNAFPFFSKFYCIDFLDSEIKVFITGLIRSTVEYREKFNVERCDILGLLIKLRQNQSILEEGEKPDYWSSNFRPGRKEGLTIEEISAETFLFFMTAYETTSNSILFCLYELACNSVIQDKLYWEVQEVLSRHNGNISYQALQEITYMDQVINETMRRYPVIPFLLRTCTQTYKVPNSTLVIEKGLRIIIPVYSLHHDQKYFPNPYTFDPERFNADTSKERHPYIFLPFGEGPRMCIGFRLGLMKIKTAVATIISDYEISLTADTEVPLTMKGASYTTIPHKPLLLCFNRRDPKT